MKKYFLKNSDKEVKIGDTVHITVPADTPYGRTTCDIDVKVTQSSLAQLITDKLVDAQECINIEEYKPFVRRLAEREKISFDEALELLDDIKEVSIYAHNALLKELMAEVFNGGKTHTRMEYYVQNDVVGYGEVTLPIASFINKDDACKAARLMKPFYDEAREQKNKKCNKG